MTDPPYAIGPTRTALEPGAVQGPVRRGHEHDLLISPMLGMQSQNWRERATHSRGYADNDPARFQQWCVVWLAECLRVLVPGGHLVAFGGTRTWHRLVSAAEDTGFEIRDSLAWLHGQGSPKPLDVGRAVEAHRQTHVEAPEVSAAEWSGLSGGHPHPGQADWSGWSTTLKPSHEPILLARKPVVGTVAENVNTHGTGAINVRACRVDARDDEAGQVGLFAAEAGTTLLDGRVADPAGTRWPTNVVLDSGQAAVLDSVGHGLPSRFFWSSKPNRAERVVVDGVSHPTVKPLDLMRLLVRLVTPSGGTVLDPFAGSGTTVEAAVVEGFDVVGVEREAFYVPLIEYRMNRRVDPVRALAAEGDDAMGLLELPGDEG